MHIAVIKLTIINSWLGADEFLQGGKQFFLDQCLCCRKPLKPICWHNISNLINAHFYIFCQRL